MAWFHRCCQPELDTSLLHTSKPTRLWLTGIQIFRLLTLGTPDAALVSMTMTCDLVRYVCEHVCGQVTLRYLVTLTKMSAEHFGMSTE